jgi:hypothetical protein
MENRITRRRLILSALLLAAAPARAGEDPARPDLGGLIGSRPLVVFADTPDDPKFIQQMTWLAARPGDLAERRVVVLTDTDPAAKGPLRLRLRPRDFALVLIEVDGQIAQRWPLPTTVREITNLIDRTPSRRMETGSFRP